VPSQQGGKTKAYWGYVEDKQRSCGASGQARVDRFNGDAVKKRRAQPRGKGSTLGGYPGRDVSFASIEYAILLSVVFVAYWALGRRALARTVMLLAASYLFYAWWNAYYLLLIVVSSLLDYFVGWRLHHSARPRARAGWLAVSLVGNLGLLATFKYFNFFAGAVCAGLQALGLSCETPQLGVALPVGISFYTFQSMSYTIDIYRGELEPTRNPLLFALYVAFFLQLVAGPIVRARYFLPQLAVDPSLDGETGNKAFLLIAGGLLKKLVIADLLAIQLVDRVFEMPGLYTSAELLAAVYGYAFQIFCDFSAYSDIAIGSALLLGLKIPPNFDRPYRAGDLRDFWHRWHISLSSWLRDYLYIPLGGNRKGRVRTYVNLMITMLLGGLWHGAAWTFVVWGGLHGFYLGVERFIRERVGPTRVGGRIARTAAFSFFLALLTYFLVNITWVFFRAQNFAQAWSLTRSMLGFGAPGGELVLSSFLVITVLTVTVGMLAVHWFMRNRSLEDVVARVPWPVLGVVWAGMLFLIVITQGTGNAFIYFQF